MLREHQNITITESDKNSLNNKLKNQNWFLYSNVLFSYYKFITHFCLSKRAPSMKYCDEMEQKHVICC